MKATYGYKDGSGDFFITIDTDLCDGCGAPLTAYPGECFAARSKNRRFESSFVETSGKV